MNWQHTNQAAWQQQVKDQHGDAVTFKEGGTRSTSRVYACLDGNKFVGEFVVLQPGSAEDSTLGTGMVHPA